MWKWNKPVCRGPLLLCELTFPGMKQQRLESTYFMKVMLSRERRVSTAARMSAWRASEWFLLSDSLLETNDEKQGEDLSHFYQLIAVIKMFNHLELCITTSQRALMCPCSTNINHTSCVCLIVILRLYSRNLIFTWHENIFFLCLFFSPLMWS